MLEFMTFPGGKGGLYRQLINLIPVHDTYIETHLGGGAVMRHKAPANRSIGIDVDPDVVRDWQSEAVRGLLVVQGDATDFLRSFAFVGSEFIYADPPYVQSSRRRTRVYRHELDDEGHVRLLDALCAAPAKVMISGYSSPLYEERLAHWNRVEFSTGSHGLARTEIVWLNYEPPAVPFDKRFAGATFRERQHIKRKQVRLQQRISELSPVERALFLDWVQTTYGGIEQRAS